MTLSSPNKPIHQIPGSASELEESSVGGLAGSARTLRLEFALLQQTWDVPVSLHGGLYKCVEHLFLQRSADVLETFQLYCASDGRDDGEPGYIYKVYTGTNVAEFATATRPGAVTPGRVAAGINLNPTSTPCAFTDLARGVVELAVDEPQYKELQFDNERVAFVQEEPDLPWFSKAVWSTATVNDLPDSAFMYIAAGGFKDGSDRTTPRSLRYFPVRDKNGKLDLPHLRNAIARIPQSKVPGLNDAGKKRLQDKARRLLVEAEGKTSTTKSLGVRFLKAELDQEPTGDDVEERFVLGVVLEPEVEDSQGDIYSADEIRKTAHRYMEFYRQSGVMHERMADEKEIRILESYLAPEDCKIGDEMVKKGTWLLGARIASDALWKKVKDGEFTGWSIGGTGIREPVSSTP